MAEIDRCIFVGGYRLGDLCLQLKGNHLFLDGFRRTYIITNREENLRSLFSAQGISCDPYIIISDQYLENLYPEIPTVENLHPMIGGWLKQQMIKLAALDHLEFDTMAIQDPDTFWVHPWHQLDSFGEPVLLVIPNLTESFDYYRIFTDLTGLPRQSNNCYVTEFMMVKKSDWQSLKETIQKRTGKSWLASIRNAIRPDQSGMTWFSEYELLGNWIVNHRPKVTLVPQKRLEIVAWEEISKFQDHDVICNVGKDKNLFTVDWYGDQSINHIEQWQSKFPFYR